MSWGLGRREKKKKDCPPVQFCAQSVQSGLLESRMAQGLGSEAQRRLFEQIRQAVPLVDAAIGKIIRLVGDFELECSNRQAQEELRRWCSQVPVRQMLEQIVAKLGLPPFILGLSWSTTERMSQQQSEILASELESYRALLTPVILRICRYHLEQTGLGGKVQVKWKHISIADEVEQARAKLLDMQAKEIEAKINQRDRQQEGEQDEV